ncbi:hypothetical protein AMTRI_Chr02g262690 [Amborella trichopoda]
MRISPFLNCFTRRFKHNSIRMCVLHSNNANVHYSRNFQNYFTQNGILHQTSYAHTPQQNEVSKKKNQHLIEVTPTLLINTHVRYVHWGDALLTSCYMINRMPSSILYGKTPTLLSFLILHCLLFLLECLGVFALFMC